MKYLYLINNEEKTRKEFKEGLAQVYAKTHYAGLVGISVPNYSKAEYLIRQMQIGKLGGVISSKIYKIKQVGV